MHVASERESVGRDELQASTPTIEEAKVRGQLVLCVRDVRGRERGEGEKDRRCKETRQRPRDRKHGPPGQDDQKARTENSKQQQQKNSFPTSHATAATILRDGTRNKVGARRGPIPYSGRVDDAAWVSSAPDGGCYSWCIKGGCGNLGPAARGSRTVGLMGERHYYNRSLAAREMGTVV